MNDRFQALSSSDRMTDMLAAADTSLHACSCQQYCGASKSAIAKPQPYRHVAFDHLVPGSDCAIDLLASPNRALLNRYPDEQLKQDRVRRYSCP
jgi:hypothetical protein